MSDKTQLQGSSLNKCRIQQRDLQGTSLHSMLPFPASTTEQQKAPGVHNHQALAPSLLVRLCQRPGDRTRKGWYQASAMHCARLLPTGFSF